MKVLSLILLAASSLLPALRLTAQPPPISAPTLPVSEIQPGMQGEWKTVVSGSQIETFRFEVLGTARNFTGPQRDIIIARALDESQIVSGPVAGMSGSPCFIDGKLVGAYAYGYSWPKEQTIIGITPIADMLETFEKEAQRQPDKARQAGYPGYHGEASHWQPRSGQEQMSGIPLDSVLKPLPSPLMVSGISADTLAAFSEEFARRGVEPMRAPIGTTSDLSATDIQTGSPVAGVLMTGDFQFAGVGTVTWREGDQVLAFGHPFFATGDDNMPMAPAEIITVIQSMPGSFKLSNVGPVVGTIYQDRLTAIAGAVGAPPPMTEVSIHVHGPGTAERTFSSQLYQSRQWSPLITALALLESLNNTMEASAEQTFYVHVKMDVAGFGPLEFDHVATGPSGAVGTAFRLMRDYDLLLNNPFGMAEVKSIAVDIKIADEWVRSSLYSIQILSGELHPGDNLELAVTLNNYLEERTRHRFNIPIPPGTAGEKLTVFVGDASAADKLDRSGVLNTADSLAGIVNYLRTGRSNDRLYVKVLREARGLNVNGRRLGELPASVRALLDSERSPTPVTDNRTVTLWETSLQVPGVFDGEYTLPAHIR
ncbi:hypothetical protein H5P28_08490 [Ruficoccus amylovorans]|uniref:Peptidase S55 domain-containing protein n=1 Tax=Ruficoccus amylovorans TaxID=1804625 RepID=A0A842HE38_9BACT|nr:hypothetical protein [Ruficoccus amylovorans]MBC2594298.1 hypothetical protein [Ruficoccus amylovorans]